MTSQSESRRRNDLRAGYVFIPHLTALLLLLKKNPVLRCVLEILLVIFTFLCICNPTLSRPLSVFQKNIYLGSLDRRVPAIRITDGWMDAWILCLWRDVGWVYGLCLSGIIGLTARVGCRHNCGHTTQTAFMYLYYGLAGMKIRLCKPYYITTMQISQMVVGVAICVAGGYYIVKGKS